VLGMWPTELVNLPSAALLHAALLDVTVVLGLQSSIGRRRLQVLYHFAVITKSRHWHSSSRRLNRRLNMPWDMWRLGMQT